MIYYIKGAITELTRTNAVVECSGAGYETYITAKTYENLVSDGALTPSGDASGMEVKLYTSVRIKDESQFEVFGFYSKKERFMFLLLQTVSGIGTRAALSILSSLSPDEVCNAIKTDDTRLISTAQGVGVKAAQKICIDLKSKIDTFILEFGVENDIVSRETITQQRETLDANRSLALDALVNLGYTKTQAHKALLKAQGDTVEELIRTSLANLLG